MESVFAAHINESMDVQTVKEHCLNTADIAASSLQSIGLAHVGFVAGVLHDCGKMHPQFDEYIRAAASGKNVHRGSVIHSFAGVSYVLDRFHHTGDDYQKLTSEIIAYAIGAHHGLFDLYDCNRESGFLHRLQKQPQYDHKCIENFFPYVLSEELLKEYMQAATHEVHTLMDKLGPVLKGRETKTEEMCFSWGMLCRLVTSAVMDADRKDTAAFMTRSLPETVQTNSDFWNEYAKKTAEYLRQFPNITPIQKARNELSDRCRAFADAPEGIYQLNIPTGGGKTLSGLRYAICHAAAHDKERIFYIAPLINILEQNVDVIRAATSPEIVLEHHSDVVCEEDAQEESALWERSFLEATWDHPIIVTTLVQLLNTFFSGKSSSIRRLRSLCNSVLLIDEVQSVPTKMLSLFNMAINFFSTVCKCTVVLCSATQPDFGGLNYKMLPAAQIVDQETYARLYAVFKRNRICDAGNYKLADIPAQISKIAREQTSVLVVCNKKEEAANIYRALAQQEENCFHLSAGMCMAHRRKTLRALNDALRAGRKTICVSTQVIEAGVDISFSAVIRLSAGMDSIVQSAGRCNRHGESDAAAPVYIFKCSGEKLKNLKDIEYGKDATDELLDEFKKDPSQYDEDLASPKSIEQYYKFFYKKYTCDHFDYSVENMPSLLEMLTTNSTYYNTRSTEKYFLNQAFKTAGSLFEVFDESTASVLVPYAQGKEEIQKLSTLYEQRDFPTLQRQVRAVKPYCVTVYHLAMRKLLEDRAIYPICDGMFFVLEEGFYDQEIGIQTKKEGTECDILIL